MSMTVSGSEPVEKGLVLEKTESSIGEMQGWTFDTICFTHALFGLTRSIKGIVAPFFEIAENVNAGIGGTQFTSALLLPFGLWELLEDIKGVFTKATLEGKIDSGLGIIGDLSEGADCVANITEGLVSVGAVTSEAASWAGPLGMAAAGVSAVFIAIHAKAIHSNCRVLKGIKKAKMGLKQIDAAALIERLSKKSHTYRLESGSSINAEEVIDKINKIKDDEDGAVKVKEIYKGLKARIKEKQISHALGIVITVIGIVAAVIFFATALNPWMIAAFALLGGLYILCISKLAVTIHSDRKFNQLMA